MDSEVSGFLQALLLVQAEVASELVSGSSTVVGVQIPFFDLMEM